MKRRDWVYVILPLLLSWGFDRITKIWASTLIVPKSFGPVSFILHHNHGAILGIFSDIPSILRVVSLSTGGAFLLFLFLIVQFLLPTKSMPLRIGLSLLISGIVGNISDRIQWGYVVDFIVLGNRHFYSPAFNFADAIQWAGYGLIVATFLKEGKALWPAESLRKSYWINPQFQLKYCFTLVICGLGLSLILGTYSYTYLNVSINEMRGVNGLPTHALLGPFVMTFAIVSVAFSGVLFAVGLILSHRSAGPVYAFERFLIDHIDGKPSKLKLRTGDEFPELEELATRLQTGINPKSSRSKSG